MAVICCSRGTPLAARSTRLPSVTCRRKGQAGSWGWGAVQLGAWAGATAGWAIWLAGWRFGEAADGRRSSLCAFAWQSLSPLLISFHCLPGPLPQRWPRCSRAPALSACPPQAPLQAGRMVCVDGLGWLVSVNGRVTSSNNRVDAPQPGHVSLVAVAVGHGGTTWLILKQIKSVTAQPLAPPPTQRTGSPHLTCRRCRAVHSPCRVGGPRQCKDLRGVAAHHCGLEPQQRSADLGRAGARGQAGVG